MLVRIVKMSFASENINEFLKNFNENKLLIRNFDGCEFLELYQDSIRPNIFFTYSYWKSENELNKYRKSDLFKKVWNNTKPMFDEKPQAWSVNKVISLT